MGKDESGLYYLNARYYDSVTARFITEDDPKYSKRNDPLSLNLYTYCHNDPIHYTDPSGHAGASAYPCKMDDGRGFFAGLGFGILIISGYTIANGKITSSTSIKTEPFTSKSSDTVTVKQKIASDDYPVAPTFQSKTTSSTSKTKDKDASDNEGAGKTKGDSDAKIKTGDKTAKGRTFSDHGADSANDRDFSSKNVDDIIDNNKKTRDKEITDKGEVRWRYQDKRGNTVITNESSDRIITVYSHPRSVNGGKYIPKGVQ